MEKQSDYSILDASASKSIKNSIVPDSGAIGASIIITNSKFNSTASYVVLFGTVQANSSPISGSNNQILVIVPQGLPLGIVEVTVTITNKGDNQNSAIFEFLVTNPAIIPFPSVDSNSPTINLIGTSGTFPFFPSNPPQFEADKTPFIQFAPLIDAKLVTIGAKNFTLIRITLIIDSNVDQSKITIPATIPKEGNHGKGKKGGPNPQLETDGTLILYVQYDSTGLTPSGKVNFWYLEYLYTNPVIPNSNPIAYNNPTTVEAYLYNADPETSQGTTTTVQGLGGG